MRHVDFVVVGRGLMGTACARYLAEAGCDVVLVGPDEPIDRAAHPGPFGSFHDAGRITRAISDDPVWSRLATAAIARYPDLAARSGIGFYTQTGAMMAGPTKGTMADFTARFLRCATVLGLDHTRLSGLALARHCPDFTLPEGTEAVFDPDGGYIDPRAMRQAEENLAIAAGARVSASPATDCNGAVVTLATGDRVSAGQIVLAIGAWTGASPLTMARLAMRVYQRTVLLAEVSAVEAARLATLPSLIFVPEGGLTDLYLLPPIRYPDGRFYLKIGGEASSPEAQSLDGLNAWFKTNGSASAGAILLRALRDLMPDLAILRTKTAPCAVSFTATGHPYIGRLDAHVTLLTGGNGAAAKSADSLGRLGAVAALGGDLAAEGFGTDFAPVFA